MRIVVLNHVTLDGVMQAPGRPDEDTRDGFERGGWALPYGDEVMNKAMGGRMGSGGGLLFGRRTYEDLLSHWNSQNESPLPSAQPARSLTTRDVGRRAIFGRHLVPPIVDFGDLFIVEEGTPIDRGEGNEIGSFTWCLRD